MSLLNRFVTHTATLPDASVSEHQAVVELLALAAYADDAVTDEEFEELAVFDSSHTSWDAAEFSILQHLPVAIAHARYGTSTVTQLAERITIPALRKEAPAAVRRLLAVDGVTADESTFLAEARRALG
ncbi:MAG: hypothetical protein QOJ29_4944 [Thermoleophilaceae bacterium]|jgi:hypothetical protein|nr:hypothetical protein [Thermoleophilaceae bacterium]